MTAKSLTYVEIDLDYCGLDYGQAPCAAGLGTTGNEKCFNTANTCQDRVNFNNRPVTLRFAEPADYLPEDIPCIPAIAGVAVTPAVVSLGENLGERASVSVTLRDHRHSDAGSGFDKYVAERPYDPFRQGTFFGKFRARQPFLRGRKLRLIRGTLGQSLAEMETRHYLMDSFVGPTPEASFTIVAKDALKLADPDRAQAPKLSNGYLLNAITISDTAATLTPAGVGNAEYPASGHVAIGGQEICGFTRVNDALTLTRGQLGTAAVAHAAEDRAQLVLRYVGVDAALIIQDLLVTYAGVPSAYIPIAAWQTETAAFLAVVHTATIAEPTSVKDLVDELIEQAALVVWWDDIAQLIRLQVLRAIATNVGRFTPDNTLQGSLDIREQPERRLSQVWTYFGQRNALEPVDEPDNYRSTALTVDLQAQSDYGTPGIKRIFSRWIPAFGRSVALRLNDIQLGRFRDPPRRFALDLFRANGAAPELGGGYRLEAYPIQDAFGRQSEAPIQIVRLNPMPDRYGVEAEEMLFASGFEVDLINRVIIVDSNVNNFNLRATHDSIYPEIDPLEAASLTLTCVIEEGVTVGSADAALPAFDVGSWPAGLPITVRVVGRMQGKGGRGGGSAAGQNAGSSGGPALYTRYAISLDVDLGEIWGGSGGGGRGGTLGGFCSFTRDAGGGAGNEGGLSGGAVGNPTNGSSEAGGVGGGGDANCGAGGNGGAPGLVGQNGAGSGGGSAGAAGAAIDGISFVVVTEGPGDRRGPEIN